ncbi:N-acetylmuramoyl-L-alanine amidase [Clostridium grantii]|uniref:N-acetylmuramoyl-L-alanine amidase n=1 Tax=Clostridium grantii DSM 8605 TaxID=1121316 RepID=A0A1M5SBI4_9CLOT|nr:N-acetylmuramoyl-L-alanine amidase [Clostridium grantii]SHH35874.1 N-acetylmuramoyl-L-alanine amidase [Clostridium grantii DSM 8605]
MLIAVSYGHIKNEGAVGIRKEFDMIREYAPLVVKYLKEQGHTVDVISKDTGASYLSDRCKEENKKKYDLTIDCHVNAFNGKAHGTECIYYPSSETGKKYAEKINAEIVKLGFGNRGAYADRRGLYMLKHTNSPCVIIEPCFCDSNVDMALYNADKLARAIVLGITGKEVKEKVVVVPQKDNKVLDLQKLLNKYNFLGANGKALAEDNIWGKNTEFAASKYIESIK